MNNVLNEIKDSFDRISQKSNRHHPTKEEILNASTSLRKLLINNCFLKDETYGVIWTQYKNADEFIQVCINYYSTFFISKSYNYLVSFMYQLCKNRMDLHSTLFISLTHVIYICIYLFWKKKYNRI